MNSTPQPTGRRAGNWPGPHHEAWRATLRGIAGRVPTHREETTPSQREEPTRG